MDLAFHCAYIEYQSVCRKFEKHSRRNFLRASEFNKNQFQGCALRKMQGSSALNWAVYKSGMGTRGRGHRDLTSGRVCGDLGLGDARRGT